MFVNNILLKHLISSAVSLAELVSPSVALPAKLVLPIPSKVKWGKLFGGTVPPNNTLFGGTVPPNKALFGGTVPPNSTLFGRTPDLER